MKKIFEIEYSGNGVDIEVFDIKEGLQWQGWEESYLKVTELSKPTEYCECEKPGLNFNQDMCQVCGKPIMPKPKIEKLEFKYTKTFSRSIIQGTTLSEVVTKLNEIIEWINKESK